MKNDASISEILEEMDLMLDLGGFAEARELAAEILDTADPDTLEVLARIAWTREHHHNTVDARLRDAWKRSNDEHRELIETCVTLYIEPTTPPAEVKTPDNPEVLRADVHLPVRAKASELRTRRAKDHADFGPIRRKFDPSTRIGRRTKEEIATAIRCARTAHTYQWSRAGVDDQPPIAETPFNYEIDYDKAAVPAIRGHLCVYCWSERSAEDNRNHNDGLCDWCRSANRPGLPTLPATAWRDEVITARCKFIANTFTRKTALTMLRNEIPAYAPADQHDMVTLVGANFGWEADKPTTRITHYATAA
ncbi:hypothetical protein [Lentzea flaviverrucosa]|uniref:Uncharacterized protein n=1 Tax=Lentzea flaviverrucosa TaxID=200379 RepID=A0A1H9ELM3_9PSEU|nr:hypothetical protein [Lentzea flaviverrucosa]RDI35449.1 hypothetical protein DFR72_1011200 [Lentzea flaviverrucosa]SEQ26611.1 hypothetical protein SAMN05216195_10217 [Lentzea flaviverrucosa]